MYELTIRDTETGQVIRAKSDWITAQWMEGDEVAAISYGKANASNSMKRCIALDEMRKRILKDAGMEFLWAFRDNFIKDQVVMDLSEIRNQLGK